MTKISHAQSHKNVTDIALLERRALEIRATCVQMAHDGKEGHLSSALSCTDILVALYSDWLNVSPDDPQKSDRDRFIFSKGHAVTALYAVLADQGFIPKDWLSSYARTDSHLPNHPCKHSLPFLEMSTGSLGHGLGVATGMLYGFKIDGLDNRVAVLMSDGECNEGSVWEAAMFAAAHKLDNLLAIVDNNNLQAVGRTDELTGSASFEEKFRAFGWSARTIDGNNMNEILEALSGFPFEAGRPSAIIAKTIGGAGVSFMEDQTLWQYRCPSESEVEQAFVELNAKPIHLA